MSAITMPDRRMNVAEFFEWAKTQPEEARFELVDGEVVAMAGDTIRHNLAKGAIYRAIENAVLAAGSPCAVFVDGLGVQVDAETLRIPDVVLQCGVQDLDPDSMILDAPMIVVEVISRSSERNDTGAKLAEYFAVPSIRHYLIADPVKRIVIHHRRDADGGIQTSIMPSGAIALDPPGISVPVSDMFGET